jgi:hypothetical protein
MTREDGQERPLEAYSPDSISAMLEHARAELPEGSPWRLRLEAFNNQQLAAGEELTKRCALWTAPAT